MIMASKKHAPSRNTSGPSETVICKWRVANDKISQLSCGCDLVRILMKHKNYSTEGEYTILDIELPWHIYSPKWEMVVDYFLQTSPPGWDAILATKIEDFIPIFDYLGIKKLIPRLVRHILKGRKKGHGRVLDV